MKKVLLSLFLVGVICITAQALDIPNLEATSLLNKKSRIVSGLTSKLVSYGVLDLRAGYTLDKTWLGSIGFDMEDLEKIAKLDYIWKGIIDLDLGLWLGYNFDKQESDYGALLVLLKMDFNK